MSGWHYAFGLSKEEVAVAEPPGTVKLIDHELTRTQTGTVQQHDELELVPKPSNSAADPLNWPMWRKYAVLATMSLFAGVVDFGSAIVAPALPLLEFQIQPPQSISRLTQLVSVSVLVLGASNIVWVPLANIFGRRAILILAMLLFTLGSMWCGLATSFESLLAARAIQALGGGPADTLAPDIIGEIFFVHQRGRAMAIYTGFLGGGSFVGGIAGGYIAANLGYLYSFWITTAFGGLVFLCQVFLVPETLFDRAAYRQQHETNTPNTDEAEHEQKTGVSTIEDAQKDTFTFAQSLKVGVYKGGVVRKFLAPWYALLFPGTWVVMFHYAGLLAGIVTMATVGPIFLASPPYLWGASVGLLSLGGIIGNILATIIPLTDTTSFSVVRRVALSVKGITYLIADRLITNNAKRQKDGLAEPESRLPGLFPALFLAVTGFWVFGFSANNPSPNAWAGLFVGLGMMGFGVIQIPSIGFNYIIESYNSISSDCFVMITLLRAIISFAFTFFVADWVFAAGAALPFGIFGMLMGIFALFTIPLWWYGKRMRIATAKWLPTQSHH